MKGESESRETDRTESVEEGREKRDFGECELRRGHPGNKSMADTFLGTSWTGALPPWLPIGWELPRGMHRSLPMESRGNDLQLSQWHNCLSLKKRGMEQECRKKPITLFSSVLLFCLPPVLCPYLCPSTRFLSSSLSLPLPWPCHSTLSTPVSLSASSF